MELAAPITIYWDLPIRIDSTRLRTTCDGIAECRPLMLQLFSPLLRPDSAVLEVLSYFHGSPVALTLTVPVAGLDPQYGALLAPHPPREFLPNGSDLDELRQVLECSPHAVAGLSFEVTRENWRHLPRLVSLCRQYGIQRLVLPMQRLYGGESPFYLSSHEQQQLSAGLREQGGTEGFSLTIHDPFLWRAFNPGTPFPQAGCQAANTMIAIAPDGGVYPCPTLPVRLGSLLEQPLKSIVLSSEKKDFRRRLLRSPSQCSDCATVEECRGGCRGRSYVLQGSLDALDQACRP